MNTQQSETNEALAMQWAKSYAPFTTDDETRAIQDEVEWKEDMAEALFAESERTKRGRLVYELVTLGLLGIGLALFLLTFGARS